MKKIKLFGGILGTGVLLLAGVTAFGQQKEPTAPRPVTPTGDVLYVQGDKLPPPPPGGNTFTFVNSEFVFDGKPIKGSPYSAQAITETTQVLSDGNRIVNRSTAVLYRDGEGRTRREQTLKAIGGVATGATPLQTIMISDPVAGFSYSLDPANRTARKNPMGSFTFQRAVAPPAGVATNAPGFVFSTSPAEGAGARAAVETSVAGGGAVAVAPTTPRAPSINWTPATGGGYSIARSGGNENVKKEDLGTQAIEGVSATGTRITLTIPADQIGNERPIEVVDERWFSPELQMFVMTRHSDPRSGETIYRLTNINRSEPDRSLFEVPGDYQIKEPSMRTRKPEEN